MPCLCVHAGAKWFQLYVSKDRAYTEAIVKHAQAAGYKALVLTVDRPVLGKSRAMLARARIRIRTQLVAHRRLWGEMAARQA